MSGYFKMSLILFFVLVSACKPNDLETNNNNSIDPTNPSPAVIKIISPKEGDNLSGNSSKIEFNITEAGADKSAYKSGIFLDDKPLTQFEKGPYQYTWDTTKTSDGSHTLKIQVTDAKGLQVNASINVKISNGTGATPTPTPAVGEVNPSHGSGGTISPGAQGNTPLGATIYVPQNYSQAKASAAIFLVNISISRFKTIADRDGVFIVATNQYPDSSAHQKVVIDRYNEAYGILKNQYNLDLGKVYLAGWSAGGNFILLGATDPQSQQNEIAGFMVFPGSGGQDNYNNCKNNTGRKASYYYAVGDKDTSTGYAQGVPQEANAIKRISGYENKVKLNVITGLGHDLLGSPQGAQIAEDAWAFSKQFNLKN